MKKRSSEIGAQFAYGGLDRVLHERARLSILTSLMTHAQGVGFVDLKRLCALTDGNLARHLQVLEEDGVVRADKVEEKRRPQTLVKMTAAGRRRYLEYLAVLEQVVRDATAATTERKATGRRLLPGGI